MITLNMIAVLAIQFALGVGFGIFCTYVYMRRLEKTKSRESLYTLDRLKGLEVRTASWMERGVAYVHPSIFKAETP